MTRGQLLRHPTPVALLAGAGWSALAIYFSTAGNDVTQLAWIAPVPILAFVFGHAAAVRAGERTSPAVLRQLTAAAFAAATAGNLAWVVLYRGILPAAPMLGFAIGFGVAFALAVRLTALVATRFGPFAGSLAFPALWVVIELGIGRWSPHGSAGSLAYSQADFVPLIQVASLTGLSGITFLVQFVAAGIAASLGDAGSKTVRAPLLLVPGLLVLTALGFGGWRMNSAQPSGQVTVGMGGFDPEMQFFQTTDREKALAVVTGYIEGAAALAANRAEAVVLPEKMVGLAPAYEDEVARLLSSLAEKDTIFLTAGANLVGRDQPRNVAWVFTNGRRVIEYDKRRLVPGLEAGYRAGQAPGIYKAPGGMLGVAICKDMDFPQLIREYGQRGVAVLFVPAWDFGRDARLHARMAIMRGVENGFSVARAAADGLLTGSDYFGRVIEELPTASSPRALLLADLPLGNGKTFYSRYGDWFAWLNVVVAAALLAATLAPGGRASARAPR